MLSGSNPFLSMFTIITQWLEFCFSLGVGSPLVFLLWLTWENVFRLCDLLNYVSSTHAVLVTFLLLVFPLPDIPIRASSIPILSFLLKNVQVLLSKAFEFLCSGPLWLFMGLMFHLG